MRKLLPLLLFTLIVPAFSADSAVILFGRTQQAIQTPFEPGRNPDFNGGLSPFVSTDVQNAIEEAYHTAPGTASRYAITYGLQGNKSNAWMFLFNNIPSNGTPYVIAEPSEIKALSVAVKNSTTATYTVYKNAVSVATITLTAQTTNFQNSLSIACVAGDTISAKITSGSGTDSILAITFKTL